MKLLTVAVAIVLLLVLGASNAFAFDYADKATGGTWQATITGLSNSAGGTSETDNSLTGISGISGRAKGRVGITYEFPSYDAGSGTNYVWVVLDGTVTGTVTAKVTAVNGTAVSGSTITLSGTSMSDQFFKMPFSLSSSTTITDISIQFDTLGTPTVTAAFNIEAVATPEPATFLLFGAGLLGLGAWRRRRMKKKTA